MKTKLKFGLSQVNNHAPRWMIYATSIVALLLTAKHYLIDGLPGVTEETKVILMAWLEYVLNMAQVLLALAVIFVGQETQSNHDTTGNITTG